MTYEYYYKILMADDMDVDRLLESCFDELLEKHNFQGNLFFQVQRLIMIDSAAFIT